MTSPLTSDPWGLSQEQGALVTAVGFVAIEKFLQVSSTFVLIYDYTLTLSHEVQYFWKKEFSLIAVVFWITRYLPFLDATDFLLTEFLPNPSGSLCTKLLGVKGISYDFGVIAADLVLVYRTYALCFNDKRIGLSFLALMIVSALSSVTVLAVSVKPVLEKENENTPFQSALLSVTPGCALVPSDNVWLIYICSVLFETSILIVTAFKAYGFRKFGHSKLHNVVFRDGIIFYIYLLSITVANIMALNFAPIQLQWSLVSWHRVLHAIFSQRILMNIRQAAARDSGDGVSEAVALSTVRFGGVALAGAGNAHASGSSSGSTTDQLAITTSEWVNSIPEADSSSS